MSPESDRKLYLNLIFTNIFQLVLVFLRLGIIVDFLSDSTIVGFISGPATIISLQQLKGAFGLTHFTIKTDVISVLHAMFKRQDEEFTGGFSEANLLGEGGFGRVYRGVLLTGEDVAVKRLKVRSEQGECEFSTEVEILSRVHHKHVVSLVGHCTEGAERILVYELVPNKTLKFHLHGEGQPTLDWPTRLKIAVGCAKGLAYLHGDCRHKIIHRDIKAGNILLDSRFEAKIADFGLAKCTSDANSHVSTDVKGTFGYLDPEYFSSGKLTEKSDIFSFGVVLLELISGRRPRGLVAWARPLLTRALEDGNFGILVDPNLQNNYDAREMARMVGCADACVRHLAAHRTTMIKIVRALEGDLPLSKLNDGFTICHGSSSSKGPSCQTTRDLEMGSMKRYRQGFSGGSQAHIAWP